MSYEKYLADEELAGMIRKLISPTEISKDEIDLPSFKDVGIGGEFMTQEKTIERCRTEFFDPDIMTVSDFPSWESSGKPLAGDRAVDLCKQRLEEWEKPDIDPKLEKDLTDYVNRKKGL